MSDFTTAQLTALNTAIASGTLKVRYADKEVTYHSLTEMMGLRALMRGELEASGQITPSSARGKASLLQYSGD